MRTLRSSFVFFFNDTATTEIYTLSLHDALPIYASIQGSTDIPTLFDLLPGYLPTPHVHGNEDLATYVDAESTEDRKSTRLNSSHLVISYAVFCLKKKTLMYASLKMILVSNLDRC